MGQCLDHLDLQATSGPERTDHCGWTVVDVFRPLDRTAQYDPAVAGPGGSLDGRRLENTTDNLQPRPRAVRRDFGPSLLDERRESMEIDIDLAPHKANGLTRRTLRADFVRVPQRHDSSPREHLLQNSVLFVLNCDD